MRLLENYRAPLFTAAWMIGLPLFLAFVAGAGAGTVLEPFARFAGTLWSIFGGASVILGLVLLGWVALTAWRGRSDQLHG